MAYYEVGLGPEDTAIYIPFVELLVRLAAPWER